MKKAALMVMVITVISKIFGFFREITLSYFYGASAITDAFLISQTIPGQIFSLIGAGIGTSFIPIYSQVIKDKGRNTAIGFTNNVNNILMVFASIVVVFVLLFTERFVKIFAAGFAPDTFALAVKFTKISVFAAYFFATQNILSGYLRLHNNYIAPALIGLPLNLIVIISIIISFKTNVNVLVYGSVLASASQVILLLFFARKNGYTHKLVFSLKDRYVKRMMVIAVPVMVSASVNRINVLVDRFLASSIAVGGITALNYANLLNGFIEGLFISSIITVIYPMVAKMAVDGNMEKLKKTITEAISIIIVVVAPATIGAVIYSKEIVTLLFGRGAFTIEAINMTAITLLFYSLGMIPMGIRTVVARVFYAFQDTRTPMFNASIGVGINIILNFILAKYLGIGGLALATSISSTLIAIMLLIALRKKIGSFGIRGIGKSFLKTVFASLAMGSISYLFFMLLGEYYSQNIKTVISVLVGALSYIIIIYFMKIPEITSLVNAIKNKLAIILQKNRTGKSDS